MGEVKIGDAFKQLKGLNHLKKGIRSAQIEDIWEQLMGKTVAKYTEKNSNHSEETFHTYTHWSIKK